MATISKNDLNRILSSVEAKSTESRDVARREHLKQISDARVAGWKDTLAATRKAKIEWKAEKMRLEEEKRRQQDADEASLREQQRLETLARADHQLKEQTEKIRQFRSQQMLVDTLDSRDSQMRAKEEERIRETEREKQWHVEVVKNIQEAEKTALAKAEIEARKSKELADDLKRQRDQRAEATRLQQQRKRAEEEAIIGKMTVDDAEAEKREALLKNERRLKTKEEMMTNETLLHQRREQLQKKEEELTKKCQDELRYRNSINSARLALEHEHFEEKQAMRKVLSDSASQDLRQRAEREFAIFERDQRMRYLKDQEKARKELEKAAADKILIDQSRKQQIKLKKEQQEADRALSKLYADQLNKVTLEKQKLEQQKELVKRQQNIQIRAAQYQQCQDNITRREEEKRSVLEQEHRVSCYC